MSNTHTQATTLPVRDLLGAADGSLEGRMEIERARALQEVQAKVLLAKKFPRDEDKCREKIAKACQRYHVASNAIYSKPQGNGIITGASIRLIEVIAGCWGNLNYAIRELGKGQDSDGVTFSIVQAFAWDLEANNPVELEYHIRHMIDLKGGGRRTRSEQEIYQVIANRGTKMLRNCLEKVIPRDIIEEAKEICMKTLAKGDGHSTLDERVDKALQRFFEIDVSPYDIEIYLKKSIKEISESDLVRLYGIYKAIRDREASKDEYFPIKDQANAKKAAI